MASLSIRDKAKAYYRRQMFHPGVAGIVLNPFYFARKGLSQHIRQLSKHIAGKTLDIGCGTKPYAHLYRSTEYVGLEIDNSANRGANRAEYYYDGTRFPFADHTFDSAVANEVFEHVFNPDQFLREVARVLRPGGTLLMTMPFAWDEHEQPYDYARYSSFGIRSLLQQHGFVVLEQRKSVDDVRVIFQLLNAYIYKTTLTRNRWLNLFFVCLFMAPFNLLGEICALITPRNADLYLDNVVLARKA